MAHGLSFKVSQGNVLQLSPALTINRDDLQKAISILSQAFIKRSVKNV
jgi:4-aminobutyrate aminotransferase